MATTTASPSASQSATATSDGSSASCTTAVPGQYGNVPPDACNSNYNYDPQYAPAVAVAVLFGILTVIHISEGIVFKKVNHSLCDSPALEFRVTKTCTPEIEKKSNPKKKKEKKEKHNREEKEKEGRN
jgi:hypothetical protein